MRCKIPGQTTDTFGRKIDGVRGHGTVKPDVILLGVFCRLPQKFHLPDHVMDILTRNFRVLDEGTAAHFTMTEFASVHLVWFDRELPNFISLVFGKRPAW